MFAKRSVIRCMLLKMQKILLKCTNPKQKIPRIGDSATGALENTHHTSHFFFGFIGVPGLHLNVSENCFRLESGPIMRNFDGL